MASVAVASVAVASVASVADAVADAVADTVADTAADTAADAAAEADARASDAGASTSRRDEPPSMPRWYDEPYAATRTRAGESARRRNAEARRARRKEQRAKYFALVGGKSYGSTASERREVEREFARRVRSMKADDRVFEATSLAGADARLYAYAARRLWSERYLDEVAGAGAFSDVFMTHHRSDADASSFGVADAVLKCSNPYPGVVASGAAGEGHRLGSVEAMTLASVPPHPAVVQMYAAFLERTRNESYLLLSAAGSDAHSMRERGELSPRDARECARRLAHAIAHCHAHGVIHRDIKPGNVLLASRDASTSEASSRFRATLIDFGCARRRGARDEYSCDVYGTPGYQAPETILSDMLDASDEAYAKVDVFAFGATVYFLCVGRELFGDVAADARPKDEARAKVKRAAVASWFSAAKNLGENVEEEEDVSDAVIMASMMRFADMRAPPRHAARYREIFGSDPPSARTEETLRRHVTDAIAASQPREFAELIASCLAYDARERPSARDILARADAWRGVEDDVEVEGWEYGAPSQRLAR